MVMPAIAQESNVAQESVYVTAFVDVNENGVRDTFEVPVQNFIVQLNVCGVLVPLESITNYADTIHFNCDNDVSYIVALRAKEQFTTDPVYGAPVHLFYTFDGQQVNADLPIPVRSFLFLPQISSNN